MERYLISLVPMNGHVMHLNDGSDYTNISALDMHEYSMPQTFGISDYMENNECFFLICEYHC